MRDVRLALHFPFARMIHSRSRLSVDHLCAKMNGAQRVSVLLNFLGSEYEVRLRSDAVEPVDSEGARLRRRRRRRASSAAAAADALDQRRAQTTRWCRRTHQRVRCGLRLTDCWLARLVAPDCRPALLPNRNPRSMLA